MDAQRRDVGWPLWPLAAACALLPVVAAHGGWLVSTDAGLIPACNPYVDGCTSISRASRHGLANLLFQMLMLPAATLQGLCWGAASAWLSRDGVPLRTVVCLGVVAAIALAAYAGFLGSDGRAYEWLRRHGIHLYFGCSYLALLASLRVLRAAKPAHPAYGPLLSIACACLGFGVASLAVSYGVGDDAIRDRFENILEWHVALWLTATFAVLAWAWKREGVSIRLS